MTTRSVSRDESFPHQWIAEILATPPLISPQCQYVYPQAIEEVELGAVQILLRGRPGMTPVLATFALGFADLSLPHGIWSCPNPEQICAVAGGYAYIVQADQPSQWMQIRYRPVTAIYPAMEQNLLIFAGFHKLWALGANGQAWETARLSWEGLRVTGISAAKLNGYGWDVRANAEIAFTVDLMTGHHTGGAGPE